MPLPSVSDILNGVREEELKAEERRGEELQSESFDGAKGLKPIGLEGLRSPPAEGLKGRQLGDLVKAEGADQPFGASIDGSKGFDSGENTSDEVPPLTEGSGSPDGSSKAPSPKPSSPKPPGAEGRVGGYDWSERRKRDKLDKAYSHCNGCPKAQENARLRQTVAKLQSALPSDAKSSLLKSIRSYLSGDLAPEDLAEQIKQLVDIHNVVIPLQDPEQVPRAQAEAERSGKREAEHSGAEGGEVANNKKMKDSKLRGGQEAKGGGAKGKKGSSSKGSKPTIQPVGDDNTAWEALLSVCTAKM